MGCDLSKQTLQIFRDRTQEVDDSIKVIKEDHENLKQSLKNLTLPMEPDLTIQELKSALVPHLEKIENMLEEIKRDKEEKLARKNTNLNEDQKKSKNTNQAESQNHLNKEGQNIKGTKEVMSILEDPAIKAMIEKNRQKFVGKKK